MSVSYKKMFDIMEKRGLKKYWLRQNGINPKVVDALKCKCFNYFRFMSFIRLSTWRYYGIYTG